MSIKFKPVPKRNPLDVEADVRFYPLPVAGHSIDFFQLAEMLSDGCTLSEADIIAALIRLEQVMARELGMGNRIKLGNLGTFSITFESNPSNSPDEVTSDKIKRTKINFRPSKRMREKVNQSGYVKIT